MLMIAPVFFGGIMQYIFGLVIGLIIGIAFFLFWITKYKAYLPLEDSFLLKLIACVSYCFVGLISGLCVSSTNKYAIVIGIIVFTIVFLISLAFGVYYKVIATKKTMF